MLTVVIPTSESERVLVRTLACLVPGATAGLVREVILADAGSHDATEAIGDVAGCRFLRAPGALGARLDAAAKAARAPWLMFLRPGVVLDGEWLREVERFIGGIAGDGGQAATFRPAPTERGRHSLLLESVLLLWTALSGRQHPDQGLLIHKRLYADLGGHRADADDPEQDLMRRLGRARIATLRSGAAIT
jgi:glycosyltransferase involved in cell wall biosynthesis